MADVEQGAISEASSGDSRALLSVSDKTGLAEFAAGLERAGFTLLSTGGTAASLAEAGLPVTQVSEVTGFPEILDGRVKTLHPSIHGGILARGTDGHRAQLREHDIEAIDMVVVNLYPFRETAARADADFGEVVEQIDIGGPAMLRAAAKNHERVWVVTDPEDYPRVLANLGSENAAALRLELATKAFAHTAAYDSAIAAYLSRSSASTRPEVESSPSSDSSLPERLDLVLERAEVLRYGENPHLKGARYREIGSDGWWDRVRQHKGSALSYLNVFDGEAAWRLVHEIDGPACVIVKHANPCGVAFAPSLREAYSRAFAADPKSAFGGVVALKGRVDRKLAEELMANPKADVLMASGFDEDALAVLRGKRKAMRVLEVPEPGPRELELRRVSGGFLVQEPDLVATDRSQWRVVTRRQPSDGEWSDMMLAWTVCARTSSNAIVLVRDGVAVGIGAGQQSRVDAAEIAARKADGRARGGACASDAFFPFRDGLDAAAVAGVTAVVQPGGSVRDEELISAAEEHGMTMVLTGRRHFRH